MRRKGSVSDQWDLDMATLAPANKGDNFDRIAFAQLNAPVSTRWNDRSIHLNSAGHAGRCHRAEKRRHRRCFAQIQLACLSIDNQSHCLILRPA